MISLFRKAFCVALAAAAVQSGHAQLSWQSVYPSTTPYYSLGATTSGYVYAYSDNGLLQSTGNGAAATWTPVTGIPTGAGTELFSTGNVLFLLDYAKGVYRSNNEGVTWTKANSGIIGGDSSRLRGIIPLGGRNVVLVHNGSSVNKVYVSNDTGRSWSATLNMFSQSVVTVVPRPGNLVLITTSKVYLSTDNGGSWNDQGATLPASGSGPTVALANGTLLMRSGSAFYTSTNNGVSWTLRAATGLPANALARQFIKSPASDSLYLSTEAGGTNGLYVSPDGGLTWTDGSAGLPANPQIGASFARSLLIAQNGYLFAAPQASGVYRSTNPVTASTAIPPVPSGVATAAAAPHLELFPNPAAQSLTVRLAAPAPQAGWVRVTALSGAVVLQERVEAGASRAILAVANLAAGTYHVQLHGVEGAIATGQFVKY